MADSLEYDSDGSDIDLPIGERIEDFDEEMLDIHNIQVEEISQHRDQLLDGFFASDDEDDEEIDGFDFDWRYENFSPRVQRRYRLDGGTTFLHPEEAQPCNYFELLFGDNIWDRLVSETNRYADQERTRNPPPPNAPKWLPVDSPTMKAFIGLIFCMGVIRLPARNDYWRQKKRMFRTSFNSIMSRDRFNLIWRYLHLHNNEDRPTQPDKLLKLRWFIDQMNKNFSTAYTPYGDVTVDESMIKFKGRLSFRQYLPAKPIKWGVKVWSLSESSTGYLHKFQVYCGKEEGQEKGLTHRVVTDLVGHLQNTNICVYMDNFYTSAPLLQELLMRGINACGTVRSNRKGLPVNLLPKNNRLQKHQYSLAQKDDLSFCAWMDTKPVLVMSNFHDPTSTGYVKRRSGHDIQQRVEVPKMLSDYQDHMKGVDLMDQMVGYYLLNHRSRKWWRRIFHYLLVVCAHNSYIVAKDSNPEYVKSEWPNFQDFIEDLADGLIGDYTPSRAPPNQNLTRPVVVHNIINLYGQKRKSCHECRILAAVGERVPATPMGCELCQVPVCKKCVARHIQGR